MTYDTGKYQMKIVKTILRARSNLKDQSHIKNEISKQGTRVREVKTKLDNIR